MSKIAKLIAKALNNSSATEASQALKMAAGYMQKEGINPSTLLQHKGSNSSNSENFKQELEKVREQCSILQSEKNKLEYELESLKKEGGSTMYLSLKFRYENLVKTVESLRVELREAKEVAIRWHDSL